MTAARQEHAAGSVVQFSTTDPARLKSSFMAESHSAACDYTVHDGPHSQTGRSGPSCASCPEHDSWSKYIAPRTPSVANRRSRILTTRCWTWTDSVLGKLINATAEEPEDRQLMWRSLSPSKMPHHITSIASA